MTDETRAPENWMLCYDVIVGRVEGRDITRRGRQPAADSFAPHFGDPVTALMLADDLNENFQAGSHWIEAENGSKLDREEHAIGLNCVAATLHDESGLPLAAISVSGPVARIDDSRLPELAALVAETAREITAKIGGKTPTEPPV